MNYKNILIFFFDWFFFLKIQRFPLKKDRYVLCFKYIMGAGKLNRVRVKGSIFRDFSRIHRD